MWQHRKITTAVRYPSHGRPIRFAVTGVLSSPRAMIEYLIRREGHVADPRVTARTDFLVVGEKPGSTKLRDAMKWGAPQISENQMYRLLGRR